MPQFSELIGLRTQAATSTQTVQATRLAVDALRRQLAAAPIAERAALETRLREEQAKLDAASKALAQTDLLLANQRRTLIDAGVRGLYLANRFTPALLLPVRIETAFYSPAAGQFQLKVRLYPDQIAIETHEPELTEQEVTRAGAYAALVAGSEEQKQDAWRGLCKSVGVHRAAWIHRLHERGGGFAAGRVATWTRAALTRVMPDRFHLFLFDGATQIKDVPGKPIAEELAVLWDPNVRAAQGELELFDPASRWISSYELAEKAGMAITIDLPGAAPTSPEGFALFAVGLKESAGHAESAALLQRLLDNHHYSRGLSFVPAGTPTNNTGTQASGFSATEDPDNAREMETGTGTAVLDAQSEGARLAKALGVGIDPFLHIAEADRQEEPAVRAMHAALWPALGGHFFKSLLAGALDDAELAFLREHFVSWVRARGPLPAIRVGNLPYGILPVTSLANWQHSAFDLPVRPRLNEGAFCGGLAGVLGRLLAKLDVSAVPRLGNSPDPDQELLQILAMQPGSRTVRVRPVVDEQFVSLVLAARANSISSWSVLNAVGTRPNSVLMQQWIDEWERTQERARKLLDELRGAPAGSPAPAWLQNAQVLDLFPWADGSKWSKAIASNKAFPLRTFATWSTVGRNLDSLLHELLTAAAGLENTVQGTAGQVAQEVLQNLTKVESDPARLERLLLDVLDLHSYRLDAWLTSLPAKRLARLRERPMVGQPPELVLGAYGWITGLRPNPAAHKSDGYVLAPTPGHAVTAAVLRSAFLTHDKDADNPFCINLTSARAASAARLVDGVREGQPLAALLGYQLERELHDRRVDLYIAPLRKRYPLVANQETPGGEDVAESVAARNVVDGLKLVRDWRIPAQRNRIVQILGAAGGTLDQRLVAEGAIKAVADAQDAVADVLVHEAVHHASQGALERSGAALDALNAGGRPPELDALRIRQSGRRYAQRVCVLFPPVTPPPQGVTLPPRTAAEPRIAAWLAAAIGSHARIVFSAANAKYKLSVLGLETIDLLDSCDATGDGDTPLEQRIRYYVRGSRRLAPNVPVPINLFPPTGATEATLGEALEVLRRMKSALGAAQPLEPRALCGTDAQEIDYGLDSYTDLRDRLTAANAALKTGVLDPLASPTTATATTGLLNGASRFGLQDAVPAIRETGTMLQERTERVRNSAQRRWDVADQALTRAKALADAQPPNYAKAVRALLDGFAGIFGRAFVVLPVFPTPGPDDVLDAAFDDQSLLRGSASALMAGWIAQVSHVRPAVRAYEDALVASHAWRTVRVAPGDTATASVDVWGPGMQPEWRVVQLPYAPGARWIGLPGAAATAPRGLTSIVLHAKAFYPFNEPLAGLLLDEWDEFIPGTAATGGMALQFDQPGAEAPQCLLLAVPPVWDATPRPWTPELLRDVLRDTLRLARVRLVDPDAQSGLGALLPAMFLPSEPARPYALRDAAITLRNTSTFLKTVTR